MSRIGLMGGSFDPLHLGHVESLLSVRKEFQLDRIIVIPAFLVPLSKSPIQTLAKDRIKMIENAFKPYPFVQVDRQEITRQGRSFSYRSVEHIKKKSPNAELFFILGLDQFCIFDQWKHFSRILKQANLIVINRSGLKIPKQKQDFPEGLRPFIKSPLSSKKVSLSTGHSIYFSKKTLDISSSQVRSKIALKEEIDYLVPPSVAKHINQKKLYTSYSEAVNLKELTKCCIAEFEDNKAFDIQAFDLEFHPVPFSIGLIASSSNTQHSKSLSRHMKKKIRSQFGLTPIAEEGQSDGRWIVLDYNDIVIHIFYNYVRAFYKLEELWEEAPSLYPKTSLRGDSKILDGKCK